MGYRLFPGLLIETTNGLSPGACWERPTHVGCPVVLDQGRPRQPRPCRALAVSSLWSVTLPWGFPAWRGPPAPSAVPASRAAGPDPPPPRNWSRKPGDNGAAPAEGTSPEPGNGALPPAASAAGPRGCLATAHTPVLSEGLSDTHPDPGHPASPPLPWAAVCARLTSGFFLVA